MSHATDYQSRPRATHRHVWLRETSQSARCVCGARSGVLTGSDLHPPGMSDEECVGILRGEPWTKWAKVPRLPKNWRGGK